MDILLARWFLDVSRHCFLSLLFLCRSLQLIFGGEAVPHPSPGAVHHEGSTRLGEFAGQEVSDVSVVSVSLKHLKKHAQNQGFSGVDIEINTKIMKDHERQF